MAAPQAAQDAAGSWKGKSKLHLSWLPPEERVQESDSSLQVAVNEQGAFATVTYTWHYEGEKKEGTILIAAESEGPGVQMAWVDSWHQSGGVLHLTGTTAEDGSVKAKGTYAAGEEVWGWTIALGQVGPNLVLKMENVTPDGVAEWAVEGVYTRV